MSHPSYPPAEPGTKVKDLPKASEVEQIERLAGFRKIVDEKQAQPVVWIDRKGKCRQVTVDMTSASLLLQVYQAMKPEMRATLCACEPPMMVKLALSCI